MSTVVHKLESIPEKPPVPEPAPIQKDPLSSVPWLPCALTLEVPVVHFTVGDFLALKKGSVVESSCHHTSDVPLRVNDLLLGWTEFEVVGDRLAVRITELL
jgi:flagellar motor switch/type III secretory pathway protein FliN